MSSFRSIHTSWRRWLLEEIAVDQDLVPRHEAMESFCGDYLIPFVQQAGYTWACDTERLTERLLNLLFVMYQGKEVHYPNYHKNWNPVHFDDYTWVLNTEMWEHFWNEVPSIEDFREDKYAYDLRYQIYLFVWNYLSLENSHVVKIKQQELEDINREDGRPPGQDEPPNSESPWGQDRHQH